MNDHKLLNVFFDSDALIAGSASQTGASFLLLQLCEMGIIRGITCSYVFEECRRNLALKMPEALPVFNKIVQLTLNIKPEASSKTIHQLKNSAHPKDLPVLAAAREADADYLVTFNTKHFTIDNDCKIEVLTPGQLLAVIKTRLSQLK